MSGVVIGLGTLGTLLYALAHSSAKQSQPDNRQPSPRGPQPPSSPAIIPAGASAPSGSPQHARVAELLKRADPVEWSTLTIGAVGQRLRLGVMAAPLSVNGSFVQVRPIESQWLADAQGAVPLTPYVGWQMVRQAAVAVPPPPWHKALTVAELDAHTKAHVINKLGRPRRSGELIAGGWKWWVLSKRLWEHGRSDPRSANFGLFVYGAHSGPIQGVGTVHNLAHTDWSQLHQHMAGVCEVEDGGSWLSLPTADVLVHERYAPRLCGAANQIYAQRAQDGWGVVVGEGQLPGVRHPHIAHWQASIA